MNNNEFEYTYSAAQQEKIKTIKEKYLPKTQSDNKFELLKELDKNTEKPGKILAVALSIVGTLIFGLGMSLVLVWNHLLMGSAVGITGIAVICIAYPVYKGVTKRRRRKAAPEILKLTNELEK